MTEFEKLGGTYRQAGNYFLPNLEIDNQSDVQIGIWGQRHLRYIRNAAMEIVSNDLIYA